jgi:hypothetical protein
MILVDCVRFLGFLEIMVVDYKRINCMSTDIPNRTDNEIMFDCQVDLLKDWVTDSTYKQIVTYLGDFKANSGREVNYNFSHDNLKLIAAWKANFGIDPIKTPLWGRHSWHPSNFCFFLYVYLYERGLGSLGAPFWLLYCVDRIYSALRMRRDSDGIPHTTGLLLSYFTLRAFGANMILRFITYRVNKCFDSGWDGVFERYFDKDHRVLEAWNEAEIFRVLES